jgi:hypothetical protein
LHPRTSSKCKTAESFSVHIGSGRASSETYGGRAVNGESLQFYLAFVIPSDSSFRRFLMIDK